MTEKILKAIIISIKVFRFISCTAFLFGAWLMFDKYLQNGNLLTAIIGLAFVAATLLVYFVAKDGIKEIESEIYE